VMSRMWLRGPRPYPTGGGMSKLTPVRIADIQMEGL
jgi:hypothetical protein